MKVVITGGAGFIGSNTAKYYLDRNAEVIIIDDLSRRGSELNLNWLKTQGDITFYKQDIRDFEGLKTVVSQCGDIDLLCHLAAQVAVTTSVVDPKTDFDINAGGTFNVLEAVRQLGINPVIIYSSTNKVYGEMLDLGVGLRNNRYEYADLPGGIGESRQLDFHSPYGCSKGSADQYIVDYSRIYGLRTVCFRQSCIYGSRQFGVEDQGWVAWFIIAAVMNRPITIYGDGKQVRDILHVEDLVRLYNMAYENIDHVCGEAFNVGGGPSNQMSLLELISFIESKSGQKVPLLFDQWRPGDQKIFVSSIEKVKTLLNWQPEITCNAGVEKLWGWVSDNRQLFEEFRNIK